MKLTQDTALGAFLAVIGVLSLWLALDYPFGTASRMGPGYFPAIISTLLTLTGLGILMRARFAESDAIRPERWMPLVIVPVSVALFGLLVDKLGLPISVMMLAIGAATASVKFQLSWKAAVGAALFSAVCAVVFVKFLGLQIPLVGTWLQGMVGN